MRRYFEISYCYLNDCQVNILDKWYVHGWMKSAQNKGVTNATNYWMRNLWKRNRFIDSSQSRSWLEFQVWMNIKCLFELVLFPKSALNMFTFRSDDFVQFNFQDCHTYFLVYWVAMIPTWGPINLYCLFLNFMDVEVPNCFEWISPIMINHFPRFRSQSRSRSRSVLPMYQCVESVSH